MDYFLVIPIGILWKVPTLITWKSWKNLTSNLFFETQFSTWIVCLFPHLNQQATVAFCHIHIVAEIRLGAITWKIMNYLKFHAVAVIDKDESKLSDYWKCQQQWQFLHWKIETVFTLQIEIEMVVGQFLVHLLSHILPSEQLWSPFNQFDNFITT